MLQQTTITESKHYIRGKYIQVPKCLGFFSSWYRFEKINAYGDHVRLNLRCARANEDLEMTVLYTHTQTHTLLFAVIYFLKDPLTLVFSILI